MVGVAVSVVVVYVSIVGFLVESEELLLLLCSLSLLLFGRRLCCCFNCCFPIRVTVISPSL